MSLAPGTRLGPYLIEGPLGSGGMGEVYRAVDERLSRNVAIKVLPDDLSSHPELRARFEREARAVSRLNHPHICTVHDVGRQDGVDYLVMELVAGDTLAHRLERGPLATAALLDMAVQVAAALDAAHRSGIVHRDLKPGNIMLTRSGAKLMDFGLARAVAETVSPAGAQRPATLTDSPTLSTPLTAEGSIVGTFQYMAPEQLEGREADARTDLFALGAVLYEAATGKRAFEGRSRASLIAAILKEEPRPMTELQPLAPPALERAVRRLLAKDPDDRWQSARDLLHELEWIRAEGSRAGSPAVPARQRTARWLWVGVFAVVAVIGVGIIVPRLTRRPVASTLVHLSLAHEPGVDFGLTALSPDGTRIALVGADSAGVSRLYLRPLGSLSVAALAGTENASYPFWSPDGRHLGFFADGKLKKVPTAGGPVEVLCDAEQPRGGAWSPRGVILFAPSSWGPLYRIPVNGGDPARVTAVDSTNGESGHRWPCFLPDGRHFLYVSMPPRGGRCATFVGSLDGGTKRLALMSSQAPVYAAPGFLVFTQVHSICAQRFDPRRLTLSGEPIPLAETHNHWGNLGEPLASVSQSGALAYMSGPGPLRRLVWYDLQGNQRGTLDVPPADYWVDWFSPDGRTVAVTRYDALAESDILLIDVQHATIDPLTTGPGLERFPIWSSDGQSLVYASNRDGPYRFYRKNLSDGTEELVLSPPGFLNIPTSGSRDGRYLIFTSDNLGVWALPLQGDRRPFPIVQGPAHQQDGVLSPDGRWLLYRSDENGTTELYVRPFPGPGPSRRISKGRRNSSGSWGRDGRSVLFTSDGYVTVVDVRTDPTLTVGEPRPLFRWPGGSYERAPDGQRILGAVATADAALVPTILMGWQAGLKP